ncbi:hypothetical protein GCM10023329_45600 [Streptomyces sanyensis]|uniref:Transcriptional regulator n=1 Tax=Streptomyces sanyensis TaxID=568869 RepID=A0ABP9B1U0_9ACTN
MAEGTEGTEAAALLARLVRCESPGAVLEALAAAGARAVPPGRKTLYVRRGDALDAYRGPEATRSTAPRCRRPRCGRWSAAGGARSPGTGGARCCWSRWSRGVSGSVRSPSRPSRAGPGTAAHPSGPLGRGVRGLDLVADCCALALRAHSVRGPPADAVEAAGTVRADGAAGAYRIGYRVVHGDGSVHRLTELGRVVPDERGRPARALGLVYESGDGDGAPEAAPRTGGARDAFLHTLTRALSRAVTVADVTRVMTDLARPALGAENLVLGVVEGGRLQIVGGSRVAPGPRRLRAAAHEAMAGAAVRERPLFVEDLSGPWGAAAAGALPPRAWAVLSLGPVDRAPGACPISFAGPAASARRSAPSTRPWRSSSRRAWSGHGCSTRNSSGRPTSSRRCCRRASRPWTPSAPGPATCRGPRGCRSAATGTTRRPSGTAPRPW